MSRREAENLISKLKQMSEEGITSFFNEVMSNQRLRQGMASAGEHFMENKRAFDRNVETMLDFVNVPSKKDVRDLKSRIDHLSSQLLNLNMKIDRMAAASERAEAKPAPKASPRRRRT